MTRAHLKDQAELVKLRGTRPTPLQRLHLRHARGQIADVAEILAARGEFVAMGRFVGHMTDEAIEASLAVVDEPALLRISYVVRAAMLGDSWRELPPLVPLLPREAQVQVWSDVLAVADGMPVEQVRNLVGGALELGVVRMLPDVGAVAQSEDLRTPAMRLLAVLGPDLHRPLAPLAADLPPDQRAEAPVHAQQLGMLEQLGVLAEALDGAGPAK